MRVSGRVLNSVNFNYQDSNTLLQKNKSVTDKIILNKNKTDEDSQSLKLKNFKEISKLFPDISFIVVADYNEIKTEYNGISNTAAFSYKNKVSIALHEDVLENWDNDRENIIEYIKGIRNKWNILVSNIEKPDNVTGQAYKYTFVNLHYKQASKELSHSQYFANTQWFVNCGLEPYSNEKKLYQNDFSNNKEMYLKNILLNRQDKMYDILFKVGRKNKSSVKYKKYMDKYEDHILYTGCNN